MKAVIAKGYGGPEVLSVGEAAKPKPKSNEILIKVMAASLNSGDVRMRALDAGDGVKGFVFKIIIRLLLGIKKPKRIAGSVLAGEVVEIGDSVTRFKVGDEVYAMAGFSFGAFAEYCALPDKRAIALKPKKASFEEAAAIPFGGSTALYFLRKAGIDKAKKVLIYGSTGAVGTAAVQIAKINGADVTAVCGENGLDLSKKLGASRVYDYKKQKVADINDKFDIIFDAVGKISKKDCENQLKQGGSFVTVGGMDVAKELTSDLEELANYYDNGTYNAVIDKIYPLEKIVDAHRYVDLGRKKGNVVVKASK